MIVFDGVSRNDIRHTKTIIRIIVEAPFPLPIGRSKDPIISCIGDKGNIVIFLY